MGAQSSYSVCSVKLVLLHNALLWVHVAAFKSTTRGTCRLCKHDTIHRDMSRSNTKLHPHPSSPNIFVSGSGSRPRSRPPVGRRKTTLSSSLWKAATTPSPSPRRLRGTTGNIAARRRHGRRRRAKVGGRVEIWRARSSGICTRTPPEERATSKRPDRRLRRKSLHR